MMGLTDIQTKVVTDLNNLISFNNSISARIESLLTAHNNVMAASQTLVSDLQSSGVPLPAAVTAACAALANEQPALAEYATKIQAVDTSLNQVITDIAAIIAPVA